jgi:hypothetical protein
MRSGNAKHARCHFSNCLALTLQSVGLTRVQQPINNRPITSQDAVGFTAPAKASQQICKSRIFIRGEATDGLEHRMIFETH